MKEKYLYDYIRYLCYLNGAKSESRYISPSIGDIIVLVDRQDASIYSVRKNMVNMPKYVDELKLAGGITYLDPKTYALSYPKKVLKNELLDSNIIKVIYDGITHLSIENNSYIYYLDILGYVDIDIKSIDERLYLSYKVDNSCHLVVILHKNDYIEELHLVGDSIIIQDTNIELMRKYNDNLGRIRHTKYTIQDGEYKEKNTHFDYTYTVQYDRKLFMRELEEAVYSEDYEYILKHMKEVDIDDIASYFHGVLGDSISLFNVEPVSYDTLEFVVDDGIKRNIARIHVEMQGDSVVNFDIVE